MRFSVTAFLLASLLAASPVLAAESEYLAGSVGLYDLDGDYDSTNFGLEYRGANFWQGVLPIVGASVNTDGAYYGYVGVAYDYNITPQWVISPNFAVAAYEQGDSRDLGGTLEFRSGIELDYTFENQHRLGLSIHHLSNASLYDKNPGVETIMLNYAVPVSWMK